MIEDSRERRLSKLSEFPCDQCGYKTPSKTLLKRYTESVHKVSCEQCNYKSLSKSVLQRHVENTHKFACDQCDYKSPSKALLKGHIELTNLHVSNATTRGHQPHISRDTVRLLTRQNDHIKHVTHIKHVIPILSMLTHKCQLCY